MSNLLYEENTKKLLDLMKKAEIKDLSDLASISDVSQLQLTRLRYGLMHRMSVQNLVRLAKALEISVTELIATFVSDSVLPENWQLESEEDKTKIIDIDRQQELWTIEFQQNSLFAMESWLLQWPTAVAAIGKNPDLPATRLLPLVKPIVELVASWNVETIATVGQKLPFNPQYHELITGEAESGDMVVVRYIGYKQKDKILYKAKVSPISNNNE